MAGGTYFFTVALADRRSDLLVREVAALRASVSRVRALYPFDIDAWVVLPEHLHAVWTLPQGDADFPTRWTLIKRGFSARIAPGESRMDLSATPAIGRFHRFGAMLPAGFIRPIGDAS